jgi:hypothetical protein
VYRTPSHSFKARQNLARSTNQRFERLWGLTLLGTSCLALRVSKSRKWALRAHGAMMPNNRLERSRVWNCHRGSGNGRKPVRVRRMRRTTGQESGLGRSGAGERSATVKVTPLSATRASNSPRPGE